MISWINLVSLIIATKLFLYFYLKSVGPAALEKKIGERAWRRLHSGWSRLEMSVIPGPSALSLDHVSGRRISAADVGAYGNTPFPFFPRYF